MRKLSLIVLFYGVLSAQGLVIGVQASANWVVKRVQDDDTQKNTCTLESRRAVMSDGYGRTPVQLIIDGKVLRIVTKSNLDTSYPSVGITVDKHATLGVDRLEKDTVAVMESAFPDAIEQFIRGKSATVTLGFWPTWPKTTTQAVEFSLIGFTVAYQEFQACEQP